MPIPAATRARIGGGGRESLLLGSLSSRWHALPSLPYSMEGKKPDTSRRTLPWIGAEQGTRKCGLVSRRLPKEKVAAVAAAAAVALATRGGTDMGNHQCGCCRRGWNWPSPLKRKNIKTGTRTSVPSSQHPESKQGFDVTPVYDDVSDFPVYATVSKPKSTKRDESNVHYADIQVFSKIRQRSAEEVKSLQSQNATEYATLNFPRAPPKYDSKNGTLV